jgi:hypothetical protein
MRSTFERRRAAAIWSAFHRASSQLVASVRVRHLCDCSPILVALAGPLSLGACEMPPSQSPHFSQTAPTSSNSANHLYMPPPGKSWEHFDNDRIECAYSGQGYDNCYAAHGDLIFEWSHGKSEAALANDRMQCGRSVTGPLSVDQQRQAYDNCLLTHGDLTPIGQQPSSLSYDSSTRAYCTRTSHDQRSFYGCMELGRRRSVRSCMDETGINAGIPVTPTMKARYMQCMAKEGFTVAGPPDEKCTWLDLLSPVPDKCFAYSLGAPHAPGP